MRLFQVEDARCGGQSAKVGLIQVEGGRRNNLNRRHFGAHKQVIPSGLKYKALPLLALAI